MLTIKKVESKYTSQKGFTLLELITVLAILSVMVAFAYPSLSGYRETAIKMEADRIQKVVNKSIRQYYALKGSYPPMPGHDAEGKINEEGLNALEEHFSKVLGSGLQRHFWKYEHELYIMKEAGGTLPDKPPFSIEVR